eukprot:scaffold1748_cov164-Amphora_coffeaeformis.AAC.6
MVLGSLVGRSLAKAINKMNSTTTQQQFNTNNVSKQFKYLDHGGTRQAYRKLSLSGTLPA